MAESLLKVGELASRVGVGVQTLQHAWQPSSSSPIPRGSAFFSVRALAPKTSANVNVRWGKSKNSYVFQLEESSPPVLSFVLEVKPSGGGVKPAPVVSPTRLLALLNKAKAFPLLKQQHPEVVASVNPA
ncbi:MAG: hypothetical protein L0Z50_38065 [Verrucomicrobiales bacterium]|nr:hypothetical protein [Verrucomicrobiales bacterium]